MKGKPFRRHRSVLRVRVFTGKECAAGWGQVAGSTRLGLSKSQRWWWRRTRAPESACPEGRAPLLQAVRPGVSSSGSLSCRGRSGQTLALPGESRHICWAARQESKALATSLTRGTSTGHLLHTAQRGAWASLGLPHRLVSSSLNLTASCFLSQTFTPKNRHTPSADPVFASGDPNLGQW